MSRLNLFQHLQTGKARLLGSMLIRPYQGGALDKGIPAPPEEHERIQTLVWFAAFGAEGVEDLIGFVKFRDGARERARNIAT